MNDILQRIEKLRHAMKKAGITVYYIPTADFHGSEYVSDYFKVREFFSGFTGSAGSLMITRKEVKLWTDGRYFLQAAKELEGTGIELMKSGEEGVKTQEEFLAELPKDAVLGMDGRTVSIRLAEKFKKALGKRKIKYKKDLSAGIFQRPPFPSSVIENLPDSLTGMSAVEKIGQLRRELREKRADALFLSRLDDIAWLLNIRADDVKCNPVALAYLYLDQEKTRIFTGNGKADIGYPGILTYPYQEAEHFLKSDAVSGRVLLDPDSVSFLHYRLIRKRAKVLLSENPTGIMKAVKNPVETEHLIRIYREDSLALTRFIRYITTTQELLTETEAAEKLLAFRRKIPEFRDISFPTISAYGENAAVIHYEPSPEHPVKLERKGFYLVDSGGQYNGGTTDVTRTIVMGELSYEEKEAFTDVALGMLRLKNAVFLKGAPGGNLDVLARERLWKKSMDYKHGTGHGVGYMLNVHEGPQGIRMKGGEAELKPGMLVSDEPGLYRAGKFGIRTENILLVKEHRKTEDGQFYAFRNLTLVPIDHKGMDYSSMSEDEIRMYEEYQKEVFEALRPYLDGEETGWLKEYAGLSSDGAEDTKSPLTAGNAADEKQSGNQFDHAGSLEKENHTETE